MATSETDPLNPAGAAEHSDPELAPYSDDARDALPIDIRKKRRDPLYILILYGLSSTVSIGGLGCALWGYVIVVNAPFDERSKKQEREGYEEYFWGMQSIVVLVFIPFSVAHRRSSLPPLFMCRKLAANELL